MVTENTVSPSPAPRRRTWLRVLLWVVVGVIVLLVIAYFVATSTGFLKSVILPRVSAALNADITVSDASIHPFRAVSLRDLKVTPRGQETLLTAPEVRVRYSLFAILGGNLRVDELTLTEPTIHIVQHPDGSSNLDPLLKAQKKEAKAPEEKPAVKPSKPPQLDIHNVTVSNATIRQEKIYDATHRNILELSNVNVALDKLRNGDSGKLTLGAGAAVRNDPPAPATNGVVEARIEGEYLFALSADLKPQSIKGSSQFTVGRAEGAFAELSALAVNLDCDVAPRDIRQVIVHFQRAGQPLGEIRAAGPLDIEKMEGTLRVDALSLDRRALNLAGAAAGVDFGTTTINCTNQLQFASAGSVITVSGRLDAAKVQLTRAQQTTPTLDLRADYDLTVDQGKKSALLRQITVNGTQNGNPLLHADLSQPMNISWSGGGNAVGDSTLNLSLTGLNLSDWKAFAGNVAPSGVVGADAKLLSQQGGSRLTFDASAKIDNLTLLVGSNRITQATVDAKANGVVENTNQFALKEFRLQVARQGQTALSVSGSGTYDSAAENADLQVLVQATLAHVFELVPQPDLTASSGSIELRGRVTQKQKAQTVVGKLTLANFTGRSGKSDFTAFGATADVDLLKNDQDLQIRRVAGQLTQGNNPGGSFDLTGTCNLSNKAARIDAKLTDFNQNGLHPFLQSALGDKQLVSIKINGTAAAQYDPHGDSSVKADLQVTNLVVNDPAHQVPATPLEAKLQADASLRQQVVDLRQFQVTLTPTDRAKNELRLTGRVDMSRTNAMTGAVKFAADSLDVTHYYDLFAGGTENQPAKKSREGTTTSTPTSGPPAAPGPQTEPAAVQLPFQNFTIDAAVGQFYLREVAISNLQASLKLDGGRVVMNPLQFVINGAPVNGNADLNLGVPGYQYSVGFSAKGIPVAPLANSFSTDYRGQAQGTLFADLKLNGAGTTGASLQKNLAADATLVFTNANIQLVGRKIRGIVTIIATAIKVPEIVNSPINWLTADLKIADGKINLTHFEMAGEAFSANSAGVIPIAPVLTNSPIQNLPINVALSRSLAQRGGFGAAKAAANSTYVDLGPIAHVEGTLGDPKAKPDYPRIALLTAGQLVPGEAGQVIRGIGGLLQGNPAATQTNGGGNTSTNQPATNKAPLPGILNQLLGPRRR